MANGKRLIAVAGGTSPTLGTSIVNALADSSTCTPFIISRLKKDQQQPPAQSTCFGKTVEIRYVNYEDESSITNALKDIHTVISVIKIVGPSWGPTQIALLNAAKKAGVKRFAPSEFELGPLAAGRIDITSPVKPVVWKACQESGLEVAKFQCGGFYQALLQYGTNNDKLSKETKKKIEKAMHGLVDADHMWSLQHERAHDLVTDEGKSPTLTMTDIKDIGRFVAAACKLPDGQWQENMSMVGDMMTLSEATDLLEKYSDITLKREKIDRTELEKRINAVEGIGKNEEVIIGKLWDQIELVTLEDKQGAARLKPVLNKLCPQVKPTSLKEYLEKVFT